jgi:hypothetical protein
MKTIVQRALFPLGNRGWLTFLVVAVGVASVVGLIHTQIALAAQSASDYCGQYTSNSQKNACKDGLNGTDCQNYIDAGFGQETADICSKAARDLANGVVTKGDVSVTPSPSPSTSPSPSSTPSGAEQAQLQNLLDQADSLSQYIDILHQGGPDSGTDTSKETDNDYGSYINGAGKKQPIRVQPSGKPNSPVILFFNGGGWHGNDHTSDHVAPDALARGYTVMDVTYRYGSSGVYYMYEDVMRGIQHVLNNAEMYGIDPAKMAIWGDSAGGSLSMRANASGKSGAKVAVGWSAPTNAYTALFHSFQSFGIGMDHSTCIPTDLAGFTNFADLANGGSGDVAQYGQGLSSNDFSALGISGDANGFSAESFDPLTLLTQGMIAGQNALSAAKDVESISNQISGGGVQGLTGTAFNIASKKFGECLDNFNVLSPALFASPDSSPAFLAGFEDDGVVGPEQAYGMRDKLRQLGIKSDALILPGNEECRQSPTASGPAGAGGCHLGYWKDFVCATLNFVDSEIQPDRGTTNCATGVPENQGSNDASSGGGNGGGSSGGNSSTGNSSGQNGGNNNSGGGQSCTSQGGVGGSAGCNTNTSSTDQQKAACVKAGRTWQPLPRGGGYCLQPTQQEITAGYYSPTYVKDGDSGRYTCPKGGTFTQDPQKGNICKL